MGLADHTVFPSSTHGQPFGMVEVRSEALRLAVQFSKNASERALMSLADKFENYILNGHNPPGQSNLVDHAQEELRLIGEDPEIVEAYLKIIRIFADMRHSGSSGMHFIQVLNRLLDFGNLKALTDSPFEWNEVGDGVWQSRRNSEAFSLDGGKTYYLLSEGGHQNNPIPLHETERTATHG